MNAPKKRKSSIGRSTMASEIIDLDDDGVPTTDDAPCLYVMEVPPSCDEELRNFHETLFGVMEMKNIQPKMISRREVLSVPRSTPDIYVLPIFEGPEFEYLISKGCKVIGPFVVDRCIKLECRLPKWRHPIYALSMDGAVVCFSGLSKRKKTELSELVRRMGGQVSNDLHDKVTVLISKNCNTDYPKYTESAKLRLPILREDWITDAWKSVIDRLSDESVTNNDMYDRYRVPLFKDMVITVSGLNANDRSNAGRLIELGKGEFTPEMSKTKCTHLITDKNSGDKFKKAREWGTIRIVTLKWLMRSVDMEYVQKENHYDPERIRASTPTKGAKPLDELDFSMVAPAPAGPGGMNNTTISSGLNSSVNSTVRSMIDVSVVKPSFTRHDSSRRVNTIDSSTMEEPRVVDATKDIDINTMNGDEDFFEGLRIFIVGMPEVRESWWKKMLNWSGATRASRVEMATHVVIVAGVVDKTIVLSGKPLLTTEWVAACLKSKRVMPHADFIYSAPPVVCLNQSLLTSVNGPLKKTPAKASQPPRTRVPSQQVLGVPSVSTASAPSLRRSANIPPPSSSVGVRSIFKGVTFKMHSDFVEEEEKGLSTFIVDGGGSVVSCSTPSHYLVCPLLSYGTISSPSHHKTQDIVSVFWLYRCIDFCSLISPSSHPLFRPLPACRESTLFEGLVFSLVGFDYEQEKYAYESLVVQHGADLFQGGKDKLRMTHTIAGGPSRVTVGQRMYDPSWIIECIVHNKVLPEDDFIFKSSAYSSYEGRKDDLWEWESCEQKREHTREGAISGLRRESVLLEGNDMGGDNSAMMDMGQFDGEEEEEPMNGNEEMEEEDSMVREITEEMEMDGGGETARTQQLASSSSTPSVNSSTHRGRSAATPGGIAHPRLQMLRTVPTGSSSPGKRDIPTTSSPTQFLHKDAKPKLFIPGVEEYLDQISSSPYSEMDRSIDELSASGVGRMLYGMVVTTGRMNNEMMETPVRGTSVLEEREQRDTEMNMMNGRVSTGVRRNILESSELERRRGERGDSQTESRDTNHTMDVDDDTPRDSAVVLPPELERMKKELAVQMAAATLASKKKEEEKASSTSVPSTSGATTSGDKSTESRNGVIGLGGRSRRKRLNLTDIMGTEAKRVPPVTPTDNEEKTVAFPVPAPIGWDAAPMEHIEDDVNADHSRILDSPIKPIRRDPTMPSTSTFMDRSTLADRSTSRRSVKPAVTPAPAKTLRARAPPPMNEKTQEAGRAWGGGEVVGEKSARKAKSTAAISRRGRGKENGEKARVFAFTSVDAEMRDRLIEAVRALGGCISQTEEFDPKLTHVVCGKMIRNEKLLGAMVSSLFIVKPSYVLESQKASKWIEEEEHEWCNYADDMDDKDRRVADSISRWKREVLAQRSTHLVEAREGKVGPFVTWRVLIYSKTRAKADPLARIVNAGGGEAVIREDVDREDIERMQPTHVLVDGTMTEDDGMWNLEELRLIHSLGARAFPMDFLYKYLTTERMNVPNQYLPEYKKLLI